MVRLYLLAGKGGSWDPTHVYSRTFMQACRDSGFDPFPVHIDWKYHTMTDYIAQFLTQFRQEDIGRACTLGFSYGAYAAFAAAPQIRPRVQILCSLSPYFKEDLKNLNRGWVHRTGKRRIRDHENYSFLDIASQVNKTQTKTAIFVGELEKQACLQRAKDANTKLKRSELVIVPDGMHSIMQDQYTQLVLNYISGLDNL